AEAGAEDPVRRLEQEHDAVVARVERHLVTEVGDVLARLQREARALALRVDLALLGLDASPVAAVLREPHRSPDRRAAVAPVGAAVRSIDARSGCDLWEPRGVTVTFPPAGLTSTDRMRTGCSRWDAGAAAAWTAPAPAISPATTSAANRMRGRYHPLAAADSF